jgi:uncharacterized SAM-dependent methyltransferase
MHLESVREQSVLLDGQERVFRKGERIHTENSYKYAPAEFEEVLEDAGFASIRRWDAAGVAYSVFHAA